MSPFILNYHGLFLLCRTLILIILMALHTTAANAMELQSIANIQSSITSFIEARLSPPPDTEVHIEMSRLDKRLTLNQCTHAPEAYLPNGFQIRRHVTIGVRCKHPKSWTLYVPVVINQLTKIIISRHALPRGHRITNNDITYQTHELSRLRRGYFQQASDIIGMVVKRNIRHGIPLNQSHIHPPTVVKKGEIVNISATTTHIKIQMLGKALDKGRQGELIRVKNLSSQKIIQAIVVKPGLVKILL